MRFTEVLAVFLFLGNELKREKVFQFKKNWVKYIKMTENFVYVLLNGSEWEDVVIYLSKEHAIAASKTWPKCRVEIFGKKNGANVGYIPTYNYYENGEYVQSE
jgi:hypothetical protein